MAAMAWVDARNRSDDWVAGTARVVPNPDSDRPTFILQARRGYSALLDVACVGRDRLNALLGYCCEMNDTDPARWDWWITAVLVPWLRTGADRVVPGHHPEPNVTGRWSDLRRDRPLWYDALFPLPSGPSAARAATRGPLPLAS